MIKAILFDFNGVIIDDETIQMKAYEQVLQGHGIALTEELYFGALGMDDRTFVRSMFEHAKKPLTDSVLEKVQDAKTELHRQMIEDLPLFPGVVTFLKAAARELIWGLPAIGDELRSWHARAQSIPDEDIRTDALNSLDRKRGNTYGASLFWILTSARHRAGTSAGGAPGRSRRDRHARPRHRSAGAPPPCHE